jgi:predicted house-cleaning NTP pyrophosphatase (Maf/HAM1 superfamily)
MSKRRVTDQEEASALLNKAWAETDTCPACMALGKDQARLEQAIIEGLIALGSATEEELTQYVFTKHHLNHTGQYEEKA